MTIRQQHRSIRKAFNLINAITACPGIMLIGGVVVKSRSGENKPAYVNRQRIRSLFQKPAAQPGTNSLV